MRAHWFGASGSIVALLLGFSVASAQDATGGANIGGNVQVRTNAPAPTAEGTAATQGEIGVRTRPAVTPEEQLREANTIARRANQLAERLSRMLDEARREKDIMRANCVNRKLTEVNANARNIEQRMRSLRDSAAAGDEARRGHEFTVLTVLSQKLEQLDQEATQCIGQSVYEPGASQVVTTVPGVTTSFADPSTLAPQPAAPPSVSVPPGMSDASPATPAM